eukprot:m.439229 g.439229  ORF g.439229 m.439229 type:complete len:68 (+) comp18356_c0_seq1:1561-1764(+)
MVALANATATSPLMTNRLVLLTHNDVSSTDVVCSRHHAVYFARSRTSVLKLTLLTQPHNPTLPGDPA